MDQICDLLFLDVRMCKRFVSVSCCSPYGGRCHGDPGLRHISILKLVGMDAADMGGVLELYPINGKTPLMSTYSMYYI